MNLTIIEEKRIKWTVWKIIDSEGNLIGRFDSRGGYTRADAEAIVNDANKPEESEEEKRMARAEMYL
jgi:glutathione peroxidase-family protein